MKFRTIRGTKDILPNEAYQWQFIEATVRRIFEQFNYREIRTPMFEETALFARSIGELTDIVSKEMYTFTDRGGTSLTLKPEMTASVIRAYIQHNLGSSAPLTKLFYISPMFRQERPQAGRLRQFHQFGAEALGSQYPEIDAEVILLALSIYKAFGIEEVTLKLNSLGCEKCRPAYKVLLQTELRKVYNDLSPDSQHRVEENPLRVLDSKDPQDRAATMNMPLIKDYLCSDCEMHFQELQSLLNASGIAFEIDGRLVRGLDYYTKTAFELISSSLGSQDALAGGGRYDLLTQELGGKPTPGIGFAAGIERLLLVLDKQGLFHGSSPQTSVFVASVSDDMIQNAFEIARRIRLAGISAEMDFHRRSLKAQMREAHRQQVDVVVLVGGDEWASGAVLVKDMRSGEQHKVKVPELIEFIQHIVQAQSDKLRDSRKGSELSIQGLSANKHGTSEI